MDYQNVSGASRAVKAAEEELAQAAEVEIVEEEIKKAKERVETRLAAGKAELAKRGKVLTLQKELDVATTNFDLFVADRAQSLTPMGSIRIKELGDRVRSITAQIAELESQPEQEQHLPGGIVGVRIVGKSGGTL